MKIKFNLDDKLPLNKMIEIPSMIIVVRAVFYENNKHYPQVSLDECLYKLQLLAVCIIAVCIIKMESKDELKEIYIKNCMCYYFYDIMRVFDRDIDFRDILLDKKLY